MEILSGVAGLTSLPGPVHLAIGVFDGVHPGHRAVIAAAIEDARADGGTAVVVTFDPHPQSVLRPESAPRLLTSTPHKLWLIGELGVDRVLILPFTQEFAATEPAAFVRDLCQAAAPLGGITVGHEWSFGRHRSGNLDLLRRMGEELGFKVNGVAEVRIDGEPVSSTRVRAAVAAGSLGDAARLLGRPFSVLGRVAAGDGVARQWGFPTANLHTDREQFPPDGVYAATARTQTGSWDAVVNIGVRPTRAEAGRLRVLEAHLLDFAGDLYGVELEVEFVLRLREEARFPSLEALRVQIARDIEAARELRRLGRWIPPGQ